MADGDLSSARNWPEESGICKEGILSFRRMNTGYHVHACVIVGLENPTILKCLKGQAKLAVMAKTFTGPCFHPERMRNFSGFGVVCNFHTIRFLYDL